MDLFEIIVIGVGLAMDAFAVSVCKGLSMKKIEWKKAIIIALHFEIFQAVMPILGFSSEVHLVLSYKKQIIGLLSSYYL